MPQLFPAQAVAKGDFLLPLQAMRTLSWKPHLGSVTLDVELKDRVLTSFTVSPIHAAIILHFQDKSKDEPPALFVFSCYLFFPHNLIGPSCQVPGLWRS